MAYVLASTTIRAPQDLQEANSTQFAQQRTLNGTVARDFFGSNKRIWALSYRNVKKADYDTIYAIYAAYLSTASAVSWQVTETNYIVAATNVHVDLRDRGFRVGGSDYISDFDLILTEA